MFRGAGLRVAVGGTSVSVSVLRMVGAVGGRLDGFKLPWRGLFRVVGLRFADVGGTTVSEGGGEAVGLFHVVGLRLPVVVAVGGMLAEGGLCSIIIVVLLEGSGGSGLKVEP